MDLDTRERIDKHAKSWILQAGRIIREKINHPLTIDTKSNPNDLVTQMDKETEQFFISAIKKSFPDHFILSEEGYGDELNSMKGTVWIIDPIDGTMNFVHQKRNFAISIGIYHEGVGEIGLIYNVMDDVLYSAKIGEGALKNGEILPQLPENVHLQEAILGLNHFWLCENPLVDEKNMQRLVKTVRGTRTYGSAALEFAYAAEGVLDGYLAMNLSPWDIAAGIIILSEAGGETTTISGEKVDMLKKNSTFAGNTNIQSPIIKDFLSNGKK